MKKLRFLTNISEMIQDGPWLLEQELVCDLAIYHMVPFPMILSDA